MNSALEAPLRRLPAARQSTSRPNPGVLPDTILLQHLQPASHEARVMRTAAALSEHRIHTCTADVTALPKFARELRQGTCLPVGSVEFIRAAMSLAGIEEPVFNCYPTRLLPYMPSTPWRCSVASVLALGRPVFVKPLRVKLFDGFVYRPDGFDFPAALADFRGRGVLDPCVATEDEARRYACLADQLRQLDPTTLVWCAEPCSFVSEWRYYLMGGDLLGFARYDDGPDDAPIPSEADIASMVAEVSGDATCALDVGVTSEGATCLVEANDAWALGYYSGEFAPNPYAYLCMLWTRWLQLWARRNIE